MRLAAIAVKSRKQVAEHLPNVLLDLTSKCLNGSKWLAVKGDIALDKTIIVLTIKNSRLCVGK